jgi:hypothetical protein
MGWVGALVSTLVQNVRLINFLLELGDVLDSSWKVLNVYWICLWLCDCNHGDRPSYVHVSCVVSWHSASVEDRIVILSPNNDHPCIRGHAWHDCASLSCAELRISRGLFMRTFLSGPGGSIAGCFIMTFFSPWMLYYDVLLDRFVEFSGKYEQYYSYFSSHSASWLAWTFTSMCLCLRSLADSSTATFYSCNYHALHW